MPSELSQYSSGIDFSQTITFYPIDQQPGPPTPRYPAYFVSTTESTSATRRTIYLPGQQESSIHPDIYTPLRHASWQSSLLNRATHSLPLKSVSVHCISAPLLSLHLQLSSKKKKVIKSFTTNPCASHRRDVFCRPASGTSPANNSRVAFPYSRNLEQTLLLVLPVSRRLL